jgi:hypothetical protein
MNGVRMQAVRCGLALTLLGVALSVPRAALAQAADPEPPNALMQVHAGLGVVALSTFSSALIVGAASGNLGKLMDPDACCPGGGTRDSVWRTTDRVLVTTGIVAYSSAAALAAYNVFFHEPPGDKPRSAHMGHRWLAIGHGAAFLTSAVTGIIMQRSRDSDPETFARAARVHTASNVVLVPLMTFAFSNVLWE